MPDPRRLRLQVAFAFRIRCFYCLDMARPERFLQIDKRSPFRLPGVSDPAPSLPNLL